MDSSTSRHRRSPGVPGPAFRILLLALLPLGAACYARGPVGPTPVPPGTDARVDLNGLGGDRLQVETGRRGRAVIGGGVAAVLATVRISGGGSDGGGEPPPPLLQFRLPLPVLR